MSEFTHQSVGGASTLCFASVCRKAGFGQGSRVPFPPSLLPKGGMICSITEILGGSTMKMHWLPLAIALVCASCATPPPPPPPQAAPVPVVGTTAIRFLGSNELDKLQPQRGRSTNIVLLLKQIDDPNANIQRNQMACHALLAAIRQGQGAPVLFEREIWWPDDRPSNSLPMDCSDDMIKHFNWTEAGQLLLAFGLPQVGKGPVLLTLTLDANGQPTGWALDCSPFDTATVATVAAQWSKAILAGQTDDPAKVKALVTASTSGNQPNQNATPASSTFWSFLPAVWDWLKTNGPAIGTAALSVFKWIGGAALA
jgi:hypothetical protein